MADLVFVTAAYGAGYAPFLAPHLFSISRCHPEASHLVLWQDLPPREVEVLSLAFPRCRFVSIDHPMQGTLHERLANKVGCWQTACRLYPDRPLCFIDCDALMVKPIGEFLTGPWDVLYTWKDEHCPLNLGVLLVRRGDIGALVLEEWKVRTLRIAADRIALSRAVGASCDASQHAFREMIGFVNYAQPIRRQLGDRDVVFCGVPCSQLNETRSVPIAEDTSIIHYKSGWHPIVLDGAAFSGYRSKETSSDMYAYWQQTQAQANAQIAERVVSRACETHVERFHSLLGPYEERGILHSEMLAVCALCDALGVEVVIESGRCRGQSTRMLAQYFAGRSTRVISIELRRDNDARVAEHALGSSPHVELRYGDSRKEIPSLLKRLGARRCALLLDGPKGQPAFDIVQQVLETPANIVAVFFHDAQPASQIRTLLHRHFTRVYSTDAPSYVERYAWLDERCQPAPGAPITPHTWRPYMKGQERILSYGPTLAVVLPQSRRVASFAVREHPRVTLRRVLEWAARRV